MVSRILISIALLCSSVAMSQNIDLSLSRVITIDTLYTEEVEYGTHVRFSENFIVPDGKVWKIEYGYPNDGSIIINDGPTLDFVSSYGREFVPFWLSEGDKIKFRMYRSCGDDCTLSLSYFLSILEFNTD